MSLSKEIEHFNLDIDQLLKKDYIKSNFQIDIKTRKEIEDLNIRFTPDTLKTISVYTDGSKTADNTGCGYIFKGIGVSGQGSRNLGIHATVFQAEICAIYEATTHIINKEISGNVINFYVDSQAAIKALNKYIIDCKTVKTCKTQLNRLAKTNLVRINWVKSHIGIKGNEIADRLAKRGTTLEIEEDVEEIPTSKKVIKNYIENWSKKKKEKRWTSKHKHMLENFEYAHTKKFVKKPDAKFWKKIRNLNRKDARIIISLATGHNLLNKHKHKQGTTDLDTPFCEKCLQDIAEDTVHYLGDCPAYYRQRFETLGNMFLNTREVVKLPVAKTLKFIKETGRKL